MINKRIIFALLYSKGFYHLSRNFRLQKVGDYEWLEKNYNFRENCENIDELAFILVTRDPSKEEILKFLKDIEKIRKKIFSPIMIGGGLRNFENVKKFFDNGADKILINTMSLNKELISKISDIYGHQSISLNIDYKFVNEKKKNMTFFECGRISSGLDVESHINKLSETNFGELILHSIDKDGTGNGYDIKVIENFEKKINKPLLLMGGAGKSDHMVDALKNESIDGIISANIFNFIGDGLKISRETAVKQKINVAKLV